MAFATSVTAGNTIAFATMWNSNTVTLSSVTVSGGCAVAAGFQFPTPTNGSNPTVSTNSEKMGYGVITTGGPCTVTATYSSSVTSSYLIIQELKVGAFDGSSANLQPAPGTSANAATSLNATTTGNGDYILGFGFDQGNNGITWTAGSNYLTDITVNNSGNTMVSEDQTQAAAGSIAATWTITLGFPTPMIAFMAFDKAGTGGAGVALLGGIGGGASIGGRASIGGGGNTAGTGFNPTSVSGILFWFKADAGVTCSGACVNNATVTAWTDQSGNGNNLTAGGTPIFKTNQVNGVPGIFLTANTSDFVLANPIPWPGQESIFIVFAVTNNTLPAPFLSGTIAAGSYIEYKIISAATQRIDDVNIATVATGTTTLTSGVFQQANMTYNSVTGAWSLRINELPDASGTTTSSPTNAQTAIGSDDTNQGNSTIVEIFAYNKAISGAALTILENYLHAKYGL